MPGAVFRAGELPECFENLADIVSDMFISDIVAAESIKYLTNKVVYAGMTSSLPPPSDGECS